MVETTVALVIILVTMVALALIAYGAVRFVPASLEVEVEAEEPETSTEQTA